MDTSPIHLLIVDASNEKSGIAGRLAQIDDIEIVSITHNRNDTKTQIKALKPDVMLIDLMLSGFRSTDVIRTIADNMPKVHMLALSPADPPHDRVMLALEAGALGFVCRSETSIEIAQAIKQVHQGQPSLPIEETYEVLQDGASELAVSSSERRDRLIQIIMGLIPLTGLIAAFTAYLWRQYWGAMHVRVVDLGLDPTTRMFDVLIFFMRVIALFGPLLFIPPWVASLSDRFAQNQRWSRTIARMQRLHLGRIHSGRVLFSQGTARLILGLLFLAVMFSLNQIFSLVSVLFIGPGIAIILLAEMLDLDD